MNLITHIETSLLSFAKSTLLVTIWETLEAFLMCQASSAKRPC